MAKAPKIAAMTTKNINFIVSYDILDTLKHFPQILQMIHTAYLAFVSRHIQRYSFSNNE
jgi:hypothetical protein